MTDSDTSDGETFFLPSNGLTTNSHVSYDLPVTPIQSVVRGAAMFLHDETLWRTFAKYGTEMIINRAGR